MAVTLRPFQITGVSYLQGLTHTETHPRKRLLFDDMGLGKTAQALSALRGEPCIVTTRAFVKPVWQKEAAIFAPHYKVTVLYGKGTFRWPAPGEIVVLNPEILPDTTKLSFTVPKGTTFIADEVQMYKTFSAASTKKATMLRKAVVAFEGRVWGLTGTPLMTKPDDMWGITRFLGVENDAWGNRPNFDYVFQKKVILGGPWPKVSYGEPTPEAAQRIARFALGRRKKDVLPELPEKTYQQMVTKISSEGVAAMNMLSYSIEHDGSDLEIQLKRPGGEFSTMRQNIAIAKAFAVKTWVQEVAEETPTVVFSHHKRAMEAFRDPGWGIITSETSVGERTKLVESFQAGKLAGLAGTIGAMGVGITLTHGQHVIFIDRDTVPANNLQAEDRLVRIGQKNAVLVTDIVADADIDKRITELLLQKQKIIDASVEKARV